MSVEVVRLEVERGLGDAVTKLWRGLLASFFVCVLISAGVWLLAAVLPHKTGSPFAPIREFCEWLAGTSVGRGILESALAFPIIEGLHLIGIALSIGVLCWFDLRLLGLALRDVPVSKVWKQVMPVSIVGFALVFGTGFLLFWAEAITAYASFHFWIKVGLILLAGINAAYFEFVTHPGIAAWDNDRVPPLRARISGFLSLVFWTAIIITGRTMAYSFS